MNIFFITLVSARYLVLAEKMYRSISSSIFFSTNVKKGQIAKNLRADPLREYLIFSLIQ